MDLGIRGRTALVAGGSAGMGRASAEALAAEGVTLFVSARGEDRLRAAAADIARVSGASVTPVVADHATVAGRATLRAACPDPDILVITITPPAAIEDFRTLTEEDWMGSVRSGLVGPVELVRQYVDGMTARRWGRIVNIATVAAKYPVEARLLSGPARSALVNYTAAVSRKLVRHNVVMNTLLPGMFATDGVNALIDAIAARENVSRDAAIEAFAKQYRIPARRIGAPADVGRIAATLCSDFANFTVGQCLVVDGGMSGGMF